MWQFAVIFFLIITIIVKKIWGAPACGIAAFLPFSGLYSPQVFTLPVVLTLTGPASLPVFPRIFKALFFDLSVFFKCLKVIIPCVSGRFFLSGSLLRRWSCHIFCRSFICASHVRQMGFDCGKFIHYRLQGFICAARDDIWIY